MDGRQRRRLAAARGLFAQLREQDGRDNLARCSPDDEVIVCLADDTMDWALGQVRRAGGQAVLVLAGKVRTRAFLMSTGPMPAGEPSTRQEVRPTSEVGMVFDLLEQQEESHMAIFVTADSRLLLVPA